MIFFTFLIVNKFLKKSQTNPKPIPVQQHQNYPLKPGTNISLSVFMDQHPTLPSTQMHDGIGSTPLKQIKQVEIIVKKKKPEVV